MMSQVQDQRSFNGPRKRQFDGPDRGQAKRPAGVPETVFRLLVPGKRVGSLIGKGGSIIKQMREETGARITVADAPPSSEERMVIIQAQEVVQNVQFGPAQLALFRVHNRLLEAIAQEAEKTGAVPDGGRVTTRLLIADTQAGSIIGRKGDIIKQIRDSSKAFIKVLTQEENPSIATREDRVVQIIGEPAQVQLALEIVSKQLRENPPKGQGAPGHPPSSGPQQPFFIPPQPFIPSSTPLSFGTAYQIEATTGALVPVPVSRGPAAAPAPLRFDEQRGVRVFTQDQFNRSQGEPDNLGPVYGHRGEALLPRRDLSPVGLANGGSFAMDEGVINRTVDYSRVAMSRPQGEFNQHGMQQPRGQDAAYERRASPPWARGTNPDGAGGLRHGGLGVGVLGGGGLPDGGPSAGVLGTGGFGGGSGAGPSIGSTVKMSVKMTIARSMLGAVIGRKGANVQQIRQVSGALVKVHDKEDQPVVEIEGSMEAVTAAQNLIQQSVMQAEQDRAQGDRMPPGYNAQQAPALGGPFGGGGFQHQGGGARAPGFGGPQRR